MVLERLGRVAPRYYAYVLAAGFSLGFTVWAALHGAQLPAFILSNQLGPEDRSALLGYLGGGVAVSCCLWLGASHLFSRIRGAKLEASLAHGAALFALLAPSGVLPLLLLPKFGTNYRFLAALLIAGFSAFLYLAVREIQSSRRELAASPAASERQVGERGARASYAARRGGFIGVSLLSALYAVIFSIFTVSEHNTFHTHAYDLGIFDQVIYYATQQGKMLFTVVHNPPESFWGVHFSPVLYLLTPLYALYGDAKLLLVVQSALLGAGAIVVYALALHLTQRRLLGLTLSVSYLLYAALHGVNAFDFHEVAFAPLFLLLTLYFLETERLPLFWLFLVLSLLIKEDIALTGAAVGLYILTKRQPRLGLAVLCLSSLYFFTVMEVVIPHFGSADYSLVEERFSEVVAPGSAGMVGVVKTGLSNPLYLLVYVFSNPDKLAYLLQLLVPVLFLPLLAGRAWLVILPALATALLSSFAGQYSIGAQYPAPLIPLVYFLAALGLSKVPRVHYAGLAAALLASSLLMMNYHYGGLLPTKPDGREQLVHPPADAQKTLYRMLAQVPPEVSVAATGTLVPHLSSRPVVQMLPHAQAVDFVLMDLRPNGNYWPSSRDASVEQLAELLGANTYGVRDYSAACCILLERDTRQREMRRCSARCHEGNSDGAVVGRGWLRR